MSEPSSDPELVRALAHGDREDALAELYDRLAPGVMAVLIRLAPTRARAEALVEPVFVELWRRAGDYRPDDGSVRSWALAIAAETAARELPEDLAEAPPTRGWGDLQAAVDRAAVEDAAATDEPAPRPSQLHPEIRRTVAMAQRRASKAMLVATFAFAVAAAFGFLWYRAHRDAGELREQCRPPASFQAPR